jgi:hypothetical protein
MPTNGDVGGWQGREMTAKDKRGINRGSRHDASRAPGLFFISLFIYYCTNEDLRIDYATSGDDRSEEARDRRVSNPWHIFLFLTRIYSTYIYLAD